MLTRDSDHDDCEDQGMGPTDVCLRFECQSGFDRNGKPIRPLLELVSVDWRCPKCRYSYGAEAKG